MDSRRQGMVAAVKKVSPAAGWADEMDVLAAHWRDKVPKRRQGRSRRRQDDILQAALRVFSREGIARARIADVAVEAGMPPSSLYEYFPSKEEIAYAVPVVQLARFFLEYAERARDAATVRDRLRLFLWLSADFARRNPDWGRTYTSRSGPACWWATRQLGKCLTITPASSSA